MFHSSAEDNFADKDEDSDEPDVDEEEIEADDKEETEADDEEVALSRVHSSLWPSRHAARWQDSLQYFRCRHLEQKRSCWVSEAGMPQLSHVAALFMTKARGREIAREGERARMREREREKERERE